jgi:Phage capsid protein
MSINLGGVYTSTTDAAIAEFDSEVKLVYQGEGVLRSAVRVKTGVIGQQYAFRRMGAGMAYQQNSSAEAITPNDTSHSKIFATMSYWRVGDYTDLFDQTETNIDERTELAQSFAKSIGRAEDQLIINALNAATSTAGVVASGFGGTNTGLTADKIRHAKRFLVQNQASGTDHYMAINAIALETALAEIELTSADYQTMRVLTDADLKDKKAFGFTFKVIENRLEGGLPTGSTSVTECFAWDKASTGLAVSGEPTSRVDYIPQNNAWLTQSTLFGGAAVIDPLGVVTINVFGT